MFIQVTGRPGDGGRYLSLLVDATLAPSESSRLDRANRVGQAVIDIWRARRVPLAIVTERRIAPPDDRVVVVMVVDCRPHVVQVSKQLGGGVSQVVRQLLIAG